MRKLDSSGQVEYQRLLKPLAHRPKISIKHQMSAVLHWCFSLIENLRESGFMIENPPRLPLSSQARSGQKEKTAGAPGLPR